MFVVIFTTFGVLAFIAKCRKNILFKIFRKTLLRCGCYVAHLNEIKIVENYF